MKYFLIILSFFLLIEPSFGFSFKKKTPEVKQKMVETRQEWEIEAQDIPLEDRKQKEFKYPQSDKKVYIPDSKYLFEKYNYPQGTRELNIEDIKKNLYSYPYAVADINFKYIAYPRYYFSPDINQISSDFYVEKLDNHKSKTKRILEYNHYQKERIPIIEAGTKEHYPNLFRGLVLVDWSGDSKKLLIKESVGSLLGGIYKTYLYVHFISDGIKPSYTIKLDNFDNVIKNYFLDYENLQLQKYRYILAPLGFSADNDNIIIVLLEAYNQEGKKVFLGTWGYDLTTGKTILISKTEISQPVSVNGLILKQVID